MFVRVYVCARVHMHVHICAYTYAHVCIYLYACVHIRVRKVAMRVREAFGVLGVLVFSVVCVCLCVRACDASNERNGHAGVRYF